jgi:hypothetical protein
VRPHALVAAAVVQQQWGDACRESADNLKQSQDRPLQATAREGEGMGKRSCVSSNHESAYKGGSSTNRNKLSKKGVGGPTDRLI